MDRGLLIAFLTFLLVVLLALIIFYYSNLRDKKSDISQRIRKETQPDQPEGISRSRQWKVSFLGMISRFGEMVKPKKDAEVSKIRTKLMQAGYYGENGPMAFFGSKIFTALLFSVLCLIMRVMVLQTLPAQQFLLLIIFSVAAGLYLPDYYLYQKKKERKRQIFEGFPDALDLMVVCVEAGMGLDAAFKRVGDEMASKNKVLSEEFKLLSLELRAGKARADTLRNLAMRTDLEDVSSLATLLIQTDRFGTRIAQALRVHSDSMRTKRYQRAEEIAAKLPVKILFPLVLFILPTIVITMTGPAMIKFYRIMMRGTLEW